MVSMSQQKKVLPLKHFFVYPVQALSALGAATFAISDLIIVINLFYHPLQYSQERAFINDVTHLGGMQFCDIMANG